jgi:hypothetical protein
MGGFLLDSIISGIVKHVRRERRLKNTADWLTLNGKILEFTLRDGVWNEPRPFLAYTYSVNGESQHGVIWGLPLNKAEIAQITYLSGTLPDLKIRCNPADPYSHWVLNEDNPQLPFQIDHDKP